MKLLEKYYNRLPLLPELRAEFQAIEITSVTRWFYEENDRYHWNVYTDFPVLTPPYRVLWLESEPPRYTRVNGQIVEHYLDKGRRAALILTLDLAGDARRTALEQYELHKILTPLVSPAESAAAALQADYIELAAAARAAAASGHEARWIMAIDLYQDTGYALGYAGRAGFYLDPQGMPIDLPRVPMALSAGLYWALLQVGQHPWDVEAWLYPYLAALSLINAKCVTLEDAPLPATLAEKLRIAGRPALPFKVVRIGARR